LANHSQRSASRCSLSGRKLFPCCSGHPLLVYLIDIDLYLCQRAVTTHGHDLRSRTAGVCKCLARGLAQSVSPIASYAASCGVALATGSNGPRHPPCADRPRCDLCQQQPVQA
jgi:hypothetical protein